MSVRVLGLAALASAWITAWADTRAAAIPIECPAAPLHGCAQIDEDHSLLWIQNSAWDGRDELLWT
ncbi:MAG: hypothetical protein AB7V27_12520, partial [Candidatus Binatia bacterium]